jgi:hypothetical protein
MHFKRIRRTLDLINGFGFIKDEGLIKFLHLWASVNTTLDLINGYGFIKELIVMHSQL